MSKNTLEKKEVCENIIKHCIKMNESGINQGTSGNISVRWQDGMLITPSGIDYYQMRVEDMVWMSLENDEVRGDRKPSSEWRFHRDVLKHRTDATAVVHNHSLYATSMAILRKDIPAHHYMVAVSGGANIRCAQYATFGTQELSDYILEAMKDRTCCLLANHGTIAVGKTLEQAFSLSLEIENLAKQYILSKSIGEPIILDDAEMEHVLEKFKSYGQQTND